MKTTRVREGASPHAIARLLLLAAQRERGRAMLLAPSPKREAEAQESALLSPQQGDKKQHLEKAHTIDIRLLSKPLPGVAEGQGESNNGTDKQTAK
jgi:hypothetical protein